MKKPSNSKGNFIGGRATEVMASNDTNDTVDILIQSTGALNITDEASVQVETNNNHDNSVSSNLDEYELEVERVIDKRFRNKKLEYYLKWKGYNDKHYSWESQKI